MKHTALTSLLLLAALACLAHAARAQESGSFAAREERRLSRWMKPGGPVENEELSREILRMVEEDQAVRQPFADGHTLSEAEVRVIRDRDEADTKRMSEILDRYGFPGVRAVGIRATRAFVVMLLHSPSLELMKRALPHVERAVRRGELPPDDFATLTDRVLVNEGRPQLYGNNFNFVGDKAVLGKTQDLARLDERRRKLGLPPIREYARYLADMYKKALDESSLPQPKSSKPRSK